MKRRKFQLGLDNYRHEETKQVDNFQQEELHILRTLKQFIIKSKNKTLSLRRLLWSKSQQSPSRLMARLDKTRRWEKSKSNVKNQPKELVLQEVGWNLGLELLRLERVRNSVLVEGQFKSFQQKWLKCRPLKSLLVDLKRQNKLLLVALERSRTLLD